MVRADDTMSRRKQLVVDCDPGVDDAWALMIGLEDEDVDVVAITAVFGNGKLKETQGNILRILTICGKLKIPVYPGCEKSLRGTGPEEDNYWGKDALGDIKKYKAAPGARLQERSAIDALIKLAHDRPGELTLVAIGPLTNIARALVVDPNFGKNLKEVFIMGGNDTDGKGNAGTNRMAEYNFYNDPEAVDYVLQNIKSKVTIVPLDVCMANYFEWTWYDAFIKVASKKADFLKAVEAGTVARAKAKAIGPSDPPVGYRCFDQHAMIAAFDDNYVTCAKDVHCKIHLVDDENQSRFRGRLEIVEPDTAAENEVLKTMQPVRLVTAIAKDRLEEKLKATIKAKEVERERPKGICDILFPCCKIV